MAFYKKLCVSLLNRSFSDDVPSILLVGDIGDTLEKIATELMHEGDIHNKTIKVHTSNKLPLLGDDSNEVVFISLVILIVDVTNKDSLASAKHSIDFLPVEYFMGRLMFIGLNATAEQYRSVELDEIVLLANECDFCPVLWLDLSVGFNISSVYSQILRKLELSTMERPHTSLLTTNIPIRN